MALNTRSQQAAMNSLSENNLMKKALDEGTLRINQRYRDFTLFLDLKDKYHKEFLSRLCEHAAQFGYVWEMLQHSEFERRSCAESFLGQYGMLYWGTEMNRERFLMEDSIANPEMLCVYPERKNEIIRVIMLVLEKKARSLMKANMTPGTPAGTLTNATSSSSGLALTEGRPTRSSSRLGERSKDRIGKRRASDDLDASPTRLGGASAREIRAFSSLADTGDGNMKVESPVNQRWTSTAPGGMTMNTRNGTRRSGIGTDLSTHNNGNHSSSDRPGSGTSQSQKLEDQFGPETKFLVSASNQAAMAPVWVPFQNFQSASSFLAHMGDECKVQEWDPSAQLNNEISKWDSTSSPPATQTVVAASVKFDWSGFLIRVRQGRDEDWGLVMQKLLDAWKLKAENWTERGPERFHISVLLHVVA